MMLLFKKKKFYKHEREWYFFCTAPGMFVVVLLSLLFVPLLPLSRAAVL